MRNSVEKGSVPTADLLLYQINWRDALAAFALRAVDEVQRFLDESKDFATTDMFYLTTWTMSAAWCSAGDGDHKKARRLIEDLLAKFPAHPNSDLVKQIHAFATDTSLDVAPHALLEALRAYAWSLATGEPRHEKALEACNKGITRIICSIRYRPVGIPVLEDRRQTWFRSPRSAAEAHTAAG